MLNNKYEKFFTFLKDKNLLILTHDLVDIDGLVSAFTLKFLLNQIFKNQKIVIAFSELSKRTRTFIQNFTKKFPQFDFSYDNEINISKIDALVIVDTNNLELIKFSLDFKVHNSHIPIIYVDHHLNLIPVQNDVPSSLHLISEDFTSTSEIIFELFNYNAIEIPLMLRYLFLSAIITDTGFFRQANNDTFKRFLNLLGEQIHIQDVISLLEKDYDISEKIARIKGLQRVELVRIGDWLIAISNVSSFSASVASMLINIGFDISIVFSKEKNNFRITSRAKKNVCLKTGLHLGKIFSEISEGSGGGHDGAATLNGEINFENTLDKIIERIKQTLISK